jgi:hypothetical protein
MKNKSLRFYIEFIIISTCAALRLAKPDGRMKLLIGVFKTFSLNYISLNGLVWKYAYMLSTVLCPTPLATSE